LIGAVTVVPGPTSAVTPIISCGARSVLGTRPISAALIVRTVIAPVVAVLPAIRRWGQEVSVQDELPSRRNGIVPT
jgi:hypothetical protein